MSKLWLIKNSIMKTVFKINLNVFYAAHNNHMLLLCIIVV